MRVFLDTFMHYGPVSTSPEQIAAAALMVKKWTGQFFATPAPNGPNGMNCCALGTLRRTIPPNNLYALSFKFMITGISGGTYGTATLCAFSAVDINHNLRDIFHMDLEDDGTISLWALDQFLSRSIVSIHTDTWYTFECNVEIGGQTGQDISVQVATQLNGFGFLAGGGFADLHPEGLLSGQALFTSIGLNGGTKGQSYVALPIIYDSNLDPGATWNLTAAHGINNQPIFWVGDCVAAVIFPDGDVATQWSSTGGNNFSQILNNPPDPTKFVDTGTVNNKDALDWDDIAALPVMTAQQNLYAVKNDAGSRAISGRFGPASATQISDVTGLANDPYYVIGGHDNDPDTGLRWTKATFDPTQWGYNLDL